MEQLTDQMVLEKLIKENIFTANSYIYALPIIMLILAILCTIIFIMAKKNKLMVTNIVKTKRIAVTGIIISLLLACFFIAIGLSIKNDGVDSNWYVAVKTVNKVYENSSDGHWVDDIWIDGTSEWYMIIEGYNKNIKVNEDFYYKFKTNESLGKETKVYVVLNERGTVLIWYDANEYEYIGERLR